MPSDRDPIPARPRQRTDVSVAERSPERAEATVHIDDVDDVIEIAGELQDRAEDHLSEDEVEEVAREVGLDPELVDDAIDELRARRERAAQEQAERDRLRKRTLRRVLLVAIAVGVALLVAAFSVNGALRGAWSAVEATRAQVVNVLERQQQAQALWGPQAESRERSAELAGAENRVHVERSRYDQAASAYNEVAGGFPASLFRGLLGMPARAPLSNEVDTW